MILVRYPSIYRGYGSQAAGFYLAGGIYPWREELIDLLKPSEAFYRAAIINPIAPEYSPEINTPWEFNNIRHSDCIVFWFSRDAVSPITLFEMGAGCRDHLKGMVVGVENGNPIRAEIVEQLRLYRPGLRVAETLLELKEEMEKFLLHL